MYMYERLDVRVHVWLDLSFSEWLNAHEPRHDKTNKMRPAKTQISLGIRPVWSVFAVRMKKPWSLATHSAHSEDSDQTGRVPRLIWVFAGRPLILLVLSCHGSYAMSREKGCFMMQWTGPYHADEWRISRMGQIHPDRVVVHLIILNNEWPLQLFFFFFFCFWVIHPWNRFKWFDQNELPWHSC